VRADRSPATYPSPLEQPVIGPLQLPCSGGGTGESVINKHHAMTDEHLIFDNDAFADKGMRRNFTAFADLDCSLDFDKRANACLGPNRTSVEVNEVGMKNSHPLTEHNIGTYGHTFYQSRKATSVILRIGSAWQ
jgi:hypothetical protein